MVSSSSLSGWPPTCSSASTSEVNSWPIGMPAKRIPVALPGSPMLNEGLRSASSRRSITATRGDSSPISFSSAISSCDFAPSSSEATSSIGRVIFSRYAFSWFLRLASSMVIRIP